MLRNRKKLVETMAKSARLRRQMVQVYGAFLRNLFSVGDWFVTITFRDRKQDACVEAEISDWQDANTMKAVEMPGRHHKAAVTRLIRDPRLDSWEPDSKFRREPGPPVRDAALREIEHWLIELGFEAAGHNRQEIFERLADGLDGIERRRFAKKLCKSCLCCAVYNDPICTAFYCEMQKIATQAIGWVIAEEFGRAGGRWHVHLIIRGVQHLRRDKWWKRAFTRFGRSRIEPIHG
jgi:hypothetical protein